MQKQGTAFSLEEINFQIVLVLNSVDFHTQSRPQKHVSGYAYMLSVWAREVMWIILESQLICICGVLKYLKS